MFNSIGNFLKLTTFGESHGFAIGGILDGYPAGIKIDLEAIQKQLDRRKPGQSKLVTQRKESDSVKFLSGIFEGKSTGHPIAFQIVNENQKSKDYSHNSDVFRPSHADFTYFQKYGIRDYRGGGRSSARETANWVVAGALAHQIVPDLKIYSYVNSVGEITLNKSIEQLNFDSEENEVRCPDPETAEKFKAKILETKIQGDTIGGTIQTIVENVPIGIGEPIFHKLQAELAKAMLTINAAKGFEYGSGFEGTKMKGSVHNDIFDADGKTKTNHSGGIQGGISNGMPINFKVAFKPVATLMKPQDTIDNKGNLTQIEGKGRHDACVLPRAVPVVEALTSFVMADLYLISQMRTIK